MSTITVDTDRLQGLVNSAKCRLEVPNSPVVLSWLQRNIEYFSKVLAEARAQRHADASLAFNSGYHAFTADETNPFEVGSFQHTEWRNGWLTAQEDSLPTPITADGVAFAREQSGLIYQVCGGQIIELHITPSTYTYQDADGPDWFLVIGDEAINFADLYSTREAAVKALVCA